MALIAPALPLPLSGCPVAGTACRPVRPSGHSPGERVGGRVPCNSDERSVQRSAMSGVGQPVMRSLRRNHGRQCPTSPGREIRETVRAKRTGGSGVEHGRPSAVSRKPLTSGAEAATERSEGVAGAERYQGPGQPAAGRALAASEASSGRRPEASSDVEQSLSHRPWEHLISLCIL